MPSLDFCSLQIFGSDFDVSSFHDSVSMDGAKIVRVNGVSPIARHYVKAYRHGNVSRWESKRIFYNRSKASCVEDEEKFLINALDDLSYCVASLTPYLNETVEVWLFASYKSAKKDRPSGFYYSNRFFKKLEILNCSFSTDVGFV